MERIFFLIFVSLFSFSPLVFYGESQFPILARLAAPEMEGRGVGTAGLQSAHDFIVESIRKTGLEPISQGLRVFVGNQLGLQNRLNDFSVGDFMPLAFSRSGKLNAPLVFAGYGISLRNAGTAIYDDYDGLDVKDKVVVVMSGDPGIGAPESVFRNPAYFQYATPMYKMQNAALHGAAGVILVRDPYSQGNRPEAALQLQERQGGGATLDILAVQAKISTVGQLLAQDIAKLQEQITHSQKPNSFISSTSVNLQVDLVRQVGEVKNIAIVLPGQDPVLKNEVIIVGAHYDHLGFGGDSALDPETQGQIHPGADDNASGVQAVFQLAQRMKQFGQNRRTIVFAFFTAEEIGLLGSQYFVENPIWSKDQKAVAMLNLDMVGRLRNNKLTLIGGNTALEFSDLIAKANTEFTLQTVDEGFGSSDHASFLTAKIPSLFFTTGAHEDYHRISDTAEKINMSGLDRIADFAWQLLIGIDGAEKAPTYDPRWEENLPPPRPGKGYGVYFGSIPEFNQGSVSGVLLQGVRAGSPAESAGLQAGDILTALGEIQIKNLYDLVFALRYFRAGDEVMVEWVRLGQKQSAKAILRSRDGVR